MFVPHTAIEKRLLRKIARLWGVQVDYINSGEELVRCKDETVMRVLESVSGVAIDNAKTLHALRDLAWSKKLKRVLEPVQVAREGHELSVMAYLPKENLLDSYIWRLQLETGEQIQESIAPVPAQRILAFDKKHYASVSFPLRFRLPMGYHTLQLCRGEEVLAKSTVMCAPPLKTKPAGVKSWGVFAPLYGIRSETDWGIGDLKDMDQLQDSLHAHGASFFGTLPILAAVNEGDYADPSPYAPVSRLFWNEIFLNVDDLAKDSPAAQKLIQQKSFQKELQRLRALKMVDHLGVNALKKPVLSVLADEFFRADQQQTPAFVDYLKRNPMAEAYADFRASEALPGSDRGVERKYHLYSQFQMDQALQKMSAKAKAGKTTGLYLDFPVGASRGGFDSKVFSSSFLLDLSSGAPPDSIFVGGQNWGFAPLHPVLLREDGYRYFIQALRHHMNYANILRLDHVMAFQRIYVIPEGIDSKSGCYIRFRREEFFALLAIEAERSGAQIVGEDLGTVPKVMRKSLDENNCLGMWVLPFEVANQPSKTIEKMRAKTLACLNTHDMIPWAGFLKGRDIDVLHEIKILNDTETAKSHRERRQVIDLWKKDLGVQNEKEMLPHLLELMAKSSAELFLVNMEDLWHEVEAQNVPGTWREFPNWKRKLHLDTKEWIEKPEITEMFERISRLRSGKAKITPSQEILRPEDLYMFNEGHHVRSYQRLGAHLDTHDGKDGAWFSVWAPSVLKVSVIGDFNHWTPDQHELQPVGQSGIWSGFVPGVQAGQTYKYHIKTNANQILDKADPYAFATEIPPRTASRLTSMDYDWQDQDWMLTRKEKQATSQAMSIYEVHLGSWRRKPEEGNRSLTYRELAEELPAYVKDLGFTHVELMPIMEHPFYGSWGYQTTGYFAPTSRYGSPQDFMYLVDRLHQEGIGILLDWVPSHFPEDAFALGWFNGTHLFEHADPRLGFHPDWKSLIFNYGRHEVRSFLISSALFWLEKYHIDGLRVDAVASMLYLDYSRKHDEWIPNKYGGRENLEAIQFLREMNEAVYREFPDVHTIAEESTAWPKVSAPTYLGGLGFGMKWDMGWMHDTLEYFKKDPVHRRHHQGQLTFRMVYAFNENFVMSISHDEVVYGKGSVLTKMSGDTWQKFANMRTLYAYMYVQPGKKLLFMGCEFGQGSEWNHESSLDWHLVQQPGNHQGIHALVKELNHIYRSEVALHSQDFSDAGFEWLDASDAANSVLSFFRKGPRGEKILCIFNMTPIPRSNYRLGVSEPGKWREILNTDAAVYGGSGVGNMGTVVSHPLPAHGRLHSLTLTLPPLAALYLKYEGEE